MKYMQSTNSNFKDYINKNYYYVDKTLFIEELVKNQNDVILLPRPRRFGKTLNISMLKYYFDIREDNRELFKGLKIENSDLYEKYINKYPVVSITFKDVKGEDWNICYKRIKDEIRREYRSHKYLLDSDRLDYLDKDYFKKIYEGNENIDYPMSIKELSRLLYQHYDKEVVILIDEYDTPVNNLLNKDYYDKIINFLRDLISSAFKDNRYLFKGVITGILRIAKESIFSGANNIIVRTILSKDFSDKFGFTDDEVINTLKYFNIEDKLDDVRKWYNGYTFGNNVIYNPFSIANYVQERELKGYWVNSGSNTLIENLLFNSDISVKEKLEELIKGNSIEEEIEENIIFSQISKTKYLWSLLLFSGYLKSIKNDNKYILSIPNLEIKNLYIKIFEEYFIELTPRLSISMDKIYKSILKNDIDSFRREVENLLMSKVSYYDIGKNKEAVYHMIIFLSLLRLEYYKYDVKSNAESGEGRYDISVIPKDINKIGYIIEIKISSSEEDLKNKAEEAINQIESNKYYSELFNKGIYDIRALGIAFEGKHVFIKDKKLNIKH